MANEGPGSPETKKVPSHLATYADLFERMLDAIFLIDINSFVILEANQASEGLFGVPVEEIRGRELLKWVAPEHQDEVHKAFRVARRRYYPRQFESVLRPRPDKIVTVGISACVLKLSNDTEVIQVVAKDITREKEAERRAGEYLKQLKMMNARLEELSITDGMTKLPNFRHFKSELRKEHDRAQRYGTPYSIIFCDVDNFKHYNDRNGHPAGDEVLRQVAHILEQRCRNTDLPSRYGGEEFAVLCPGVTWEGAAVIAERLRKTIEDHNFPHANHQPLGRVTISIGVSGFPADGQTFDEVLQSADEAVYYSKSHGRNQVNVASQIRSGISDQPNLTKKPA